MAFLRFNEAQIFVLGIPKRGRLSFPKQNMMNLCYKQECIPVGCVPSAAVAISGGGCLPGGCLPRAGVSSRGGGICLGGVCLVVSAYLLLILK